MKLSYKKTIYVGFAFFLICAFWQSYDTIIPKILTDKFGLSQTRSGVIMALDNVLALFMLPFFGALSDRHSSKKGRRTPFIVIGTIVACVAFIALSFIDNMQLTNIRSVSAVDNKEALTALYNNDYEKTLKTPDGVEFSLKDEFSLDDFTSITTESTRTEKDGSETNLFTEYVVPARQAFAWQQTANSPVSLVFFILILMVVLLSMGIFRSPAVALMPDVTVKPLRSKANAVINLMGSCGGMVTIVLGMLFGTGQTKNALMSYIPYFAAVAAVMLISLFVFLRTVNEPKFVQEMKVDSIKYGIEEKGDLDETIKHSLSKGELTSLILILASVALWFMGYNAVTSKYSVYAGKVLGLDYNLTLLIATASAIISFIPIGIISSKIGRKKSILAGIIILGSAFFAASFMRAGSSVIVMDILFSASGIGWATINVNSYPMVVELSKGSDVGKYTGFYYTASMAAQTITPIFSGLFLDIKFTTLFPYATIFVALSFITMFFVKHGDSKPLPAKSRLESFADND